MLVQNTAIPNYNSNPVSFKIALEKQELCSIKIVQKKFLVRKWFLLMLYMLFNEVILPPPPEAVYHFSNICNELPLVAVYQF